MDCPACAGQYYQRSIGITHSFYDATVLAGLPANFTPDVLTQRKRITHVAYYEELTKDNQNAYEYDKYDHATHYDYDIHGNVKTLLQDNRKMAQEFATLASQQFKRMDYVYDLVSGNVHRVMVQSGNENENEEPSADEWNHAYRYDADNRITEAYTSKETPFITASIFNSELENELIYNENWQNDARYFYYDHGPLARVELGDDNLQGLDYVYTLQGWLKGVNATNLDGMLDPGKDAVTGLNSSFAKDVYSFGLSYYGWEYQPINYQNNTFEANQWSSGAFMNSSSLFNGNIRAMQTTITHPETREAMPMITGYQYDQLNRLRFARSFENMNLAGNSWDYLETYDNRYFNEFVYDPNGNILTQKRHLRNGTQIEELTYQYKYNNNNRLIQNRLYHVNDAIGAGVDATDIDDMGAFTAGTNINTANNYSYDEEGRLTKDDQEQIELIEWRVDGKVKKIHRPLNSGKNNVSFDYDAMGNRIAKHDYDDNWMLTKSTYYVLDASGNQMNMYEHVVSETYIKYNLVERNIYGSSRLGSLKEVVNLFSENTSLTQDVVLGNKYYELSNHLGNVLTVIKDVKIPIADEAFEMVDHYEVAIHLTTDYSPFGVELDGRTITKTIEICQDEVTEIETTQVDDDFEFSFDLLSWSAMGSGGLAYVNEQMQVLNPNTSTRNIGAKRSFTTGVGTHTVSFDFVSNNCASFVFWPPSVTPRPVNVYIRNASNTIVASGTYSTTGTYSLVFNSTSISTYTIEFYMTNASPLCFFQIDNVKITCLETIITQVCEEVEGGSYRYGFQNQEKDDEVKGEGNSVNYRYRMHDPRLGRFFAVDPLEADYAFNSPYAFSQNIVINAIELEGLETQFIYNVTNYGKENQKITKSHEEDNNFNFNQRVYRYFNNKGEVYKVVVEKLDKNRKVVKRDVLYYLQDWDSGTKTKLLNEEMKGEEPVPFYNKWPFADGSMEGGADPENTGEYKGAEGMGRAADDLDNIADKMKYVPTPITQVGARIITYEALVLHTISDFNTMSFEEAAGNLAIRIVAQKISEKMSKNIKKSEFNKTEKYVSGQSVRKVISEIKKELIKENEEL